MRLRHAFLTALLALGLIAPLRGFSLPATDSFSSGAALSASWTEIQNSFGVSGGVATGNNSNYNIAKWTADAPSVDHYVQAKLMTTAYPSVCVRMAGTSLATFDGYCLMRRVDETNAHLYRYDDGTPTQLGADFGTMSDSTVGKLAVSGTTLTVYYAGVSQGTRSDATYSGTSTTGGILSFAAGQFDDFEIGDVGGAAPAAPKGLLLLGCCR